MNQKNVLSFKKVLCITCLIYIFNQKIMKNGLMNRKKGDILMKYQFKD